MESIQKNNLKLLNALNTIGIEIDDQHLLTKNELHSLEELPQLLEMMACDGSLDECLRHAISVAIGMQDQNKSLER